MNPNPWALTRITSNKGGSSIRIRDTGLDSILYLRPIHLNHIYNVNFLFQNFGGEGGHKSEQDVPTQRGPVWKAVQGGAGARQGRLRRCLCRGPMPRRSQGRHQARGQAQDQGVGQGEAFLLFLSDFSIVLKGIVQPEERGGRDYTVGIGSSDRKSC